MSTPFPIIPRDVVALSIQEFTLDPDMSHAPSLDVVCRKFADDTNRALVWLIRFRALQAWCARADMGRWPEAGSGTAQDVCEVAARLDLNDRWEFDAEAFGSALDILASRRLRIA